MLACVFHCTFNFGMVSKYEANLYAVFQACLPTRQNGIENRDKAYCLCVFVGNNNKLKLKLN